MTASTYVNSLASPFAIIKTHRIPQGYFRSKLFVLSSSTSPIVAAAGPLFSILERLNISPTLPPMHQMQENIEHELNAFHSRLTSQNYAEEFIAIALYLMTATIDELLGKNYLRLYQKPAEFTAFTPSSLDDHGPEQRFFEIVSYIKERTIQYLDLLELAYYCLITGFEGEHHGQADGRQALDNLIEELYQRIHAHRAHRPYKLFRDPKTFTFEFKNRKPLMLASLLAVSLTTATYCASHLLLDQKAKTVLWERTVLAKYEPLKHG